MDHELMKQGDILLYYNGTDKQFVSVVFQDEMMKNGRPFGKDHFDELLKRRTYQKIADVFEQCSYDCEKNSDTTKAFYAFVQNKLHFAVTGKTAAELISERASLDRPTTWKGLRTENS